MLFKYNALDQQSNTKAGVIDAVNIEVAINSLQKRGLAIVSIKPEDEAGSFLNNLPFLNRVSNKDVVILSRQVATLFEAQVSALRVFQLLAASTENQALKKDLTEVSGSVFILPM